MCTSPPKAPEPPPPPEPLKNAKEDMLKARDDAAKRAAAVAGLAGTNVTGGSLSPSVSAGKSLLGQ